MDVRREERRVARRRLQETEGRSASREAGTVNSRQGAMGTGHFGRFQKNETGDCYAEAASSQEKWDGDEQRGTQRPIRPWRAAYS